MPGGRPVLVKADLVVLAIHALQIAVSEKNVTNPVFPTNGRLFSPMHTNGGNVIRGIAFAISQLFRKPVGAAVARANPAVFQFLEG